MAIERITDKRGIVRYQDTNTGRFVKLSTWSRQAAKEITAEDFEQLKPREKQSIKANQRIGQELQNNDIFKTFGKEAAQNILTDTFTRWVNSDPANQFNVEKEVLKAIKQGLGFTYKYKDESFIGMDGLFKLNQVQAEKIADAQEKGMKSPIVLYRIKEDSKGNLLIDDKDTEIIGS